MWTLTVVIIILLWNIIYRLKNRRIIALFNQLKPESFSLPIVGHSYLFLGSGEDRMSAFNKIGKEAYKKGGLIAHWQGSRLFVVISDAAAAEVALKTCLEKDDVIMEIFNELTGNGSIFAPVHVWRPRRKILAPTFSPKNLNNFVQVFARQSDIMVKQLKSAAGKTTFSIWKYLTTYTMDSVCETTLDVKIGAQQHPQHPFLRAFEDICHIASKRVCQPWLYKKCVYRILSRNKFLDQQRVTEVMWSFMDKIISSKLETMKKEKHDIGDNKGTKVSMKTFLELLVESSGGEKGYSNLELREETLVIVIAGTDTSAVGLGFSILMLAKHPEVQEKVYQELQEVFENSDRPVTQEDLPRLKYLDVVIRESLRLYPPVPFIVRKVDKDVTLPSGVTLVEGCALFVSIWSIHRNPSHWGEDAEQYRPERFLDTPLKHPAAFMPFSNGSRNCLGQQYSMMSMKTAIATLLRQYRVRPRPDDDNVKALRVKFDIMLKDVHNFEVQLDLRS